MWAFAADEQAALPDRPGVSHDFAEHVAVGERVQHLQQTVVQNSGLLKKGRTTGPGGLIGKQLHANVGAHVPDRLLHD